MSETPGSRAAEMAAGQVESIVAAAQETAGQLIDDARREADHIKAEARRQSKSLTDDAKRRAKETIAEAEHDADQMREQARREVESRIAEAEEAAARVLDEARSLSSGLERLGAALSEQGDRLLRDVRAAHRRMQSDLGVESGRRPSTDERAEGRRARSRRGRGLDLEPPSWVGRER